METDKMTSAVRTNLGETQIVVDGKLANEEGEIRKVLAGTSRAYIEDVEMLNGEAHFSGAVVFDLLFVDNEGANHVLSEKVDFAGKFENEQIDPLMKPIFNVEVIDTKIDAQGDNVNMTATVGIKLNAIKMQEIDVANGSDASIQIDNENVIVKNVVAEGKSDFEVKEEYDTKTNIKKVLLNTSHIELKNVSAGTGYFTVEGTVFVNSVLEVATDEGTSLKNFSETLPFKEEIENELIQKDDEVFAFAYIRPQDMVVEVLSGEVTDEGVEANAQTLQISATVNVRYIAERDVEVQVPTDAFSMTNKTNLTSETFLLQKPTKLERFALTIDGQTTIDDDEPRIAKICAVTNEHLLVANSVADDGELTIEGVAYATVVYLTDDDIQTFNSIDLEIPFSNKFNTMSDFDGEIFVTADIKDIDAKAKKGKEINVSLDVCLLVVGYKNETHVVLRDIELTEELPQREYSLEMYIAPKGSTLWDVSKHMLITEDVLLSQNPDLVFPLETPKTIVHFVQKI